MNVHRRTVLTGMLGASALVAAPAIARAQGSPMKIGFLTVKTGPLASGGILMEQGLTLYLKERNNVLAGRPVQPVTTFERPKGVIYPTAGKTPERAGDLPGVSSPVCKNISVFPK